MTTLIASNKFLEPVIQLISSYPIIGELIDEVSPLEIGLEDIPFEACWRGGPERKILLNKTLVESRQLDIAGQASCLVYELFNARSEPQFLALMEKAIQGSIDKESYVEAVEKIEHSNSLAARELIDRIGLATSVNRGTLRDFTYHYKVQQLNGHSHAIAAIYDHLSQKPSVPYRGTLKGSYAENEKVKVLALFSLKKKISEGTPEEKVAASRLLGSNISYFKKNPEWSVCLSALPDVFTSEELV